MYGGTRKRERREGKRKELRACQCGNKLREVKALGWNERTRLSSLLHFAFSRGKDKDVTTGYRPVNLTPRRQIERFETTERFEEFSRETLIISGLHRNATLFGG